MGTWRKGGAGIKGSTHTNNSITARKFNIIARNYKSKGIGWIVVGDTNYGEGSSREHAAMEPRHLGARVVLAKSFARIAETNLKKQGVLALWFSNPNDYDKIKEDDSITISSDQLDLKPNENIIVELHHADGLIETIETKHTLSLDQINWFNAGSALNWIREKRS